MADGSSIDPSAAITLYLKHYPGKNENEFDSFYGDADAPKAKGVVRSILDEAMKLQPDWERMSLNEAGDFIEAEMSKRHPELSAKALQCIGNYYTYLMR
ncbi:hypothetical protein [Mycolicibacterium frederiksbergense]|uniref:hypothetical protein n=1 Tax=Mycolicibacterium frederiksbergense TaxID=117567 RepID=UPI00399B6512